MEFDYYILQVESTGDLQKEMDEVGKQGYRFVHFAELSSGFYRYIVVMERAKKKD